MATISEVLTKLNQIWMESGENADVVDENNCPVDFVFDNPLPGEDFRPAVVVIPMLDGDI